MSQFFTGLVLFGDFGIEINICTSPDSITDHETSLFPSEGIMHMLNHMVP